MTASEHPRSSIQPAPTATFGLGSPIGRLRSFALRIGAGPICERLVRLSGSDADPRFIGAIAAFIAHDEVIEILSGWAPENTHSHELEKFGRALWSQHSLVDELRPFSAARVAGRELAKFRARRYLPVLLAARRPLPADSVASWIQRLRTFLLVRALDAQEAGYERENNLLAVCRFVLPVCDQTGHDRRKLLGRLASAQTTFFDFVSETLLNAIQPETKRQEPRFVSALVNVLKGEKWAEAAGLLSTRSGAAALPPYDDRAASRTTAAEWPTDPVAPRDGINSPVTISGKGNLGAVIDDEGTGDKRTLGQRKAQGEYLRLQHVEHSLFLRHTWHHLNEWEEVQFLTRIDKLLAEGNVLKDRLGAALCVIAVATSKTLLELDRLPIANDSLAGWTLDLKAGVLKRQPPRLAKRWRANVQALRGHWIRPLGATWEIRLADKVCRPLREAHIGARRATCVEELWAGVAPEVRLKDWFGDRFASEGMLRRLTWPSTASVLGVQAFGRTQDHLFARLVSSNPRAALPGACAYASYAATEVLAGADRPDDTPLWLLAGAGFDSDANVCGSEMDLEVRRLHRLVAGLVGRVNSASRSASEWVNHHNLLCALSVIALLTSTGARPVSSPFEALSWFDFERRLVYVEDKVSGPTRGSRICVLSRFAAELLQGHYLPHLRRLADALRNRIPEFAAEIDRQLTRKPDARLPLFFFLRAEPTFKWTEVTESQLDLVVEFGWPLPWNCFRHLHSTQLRRWGLHPDIRDALLGHADRDAESHGFHSFRIPDADLEAARPLVDRLQGELGFAQPANVNAPLDIADVSVQGSLFARQAFGSRARAERRAAALASARSLATRQIKSLLNGRSVETLSADQLDEIALRMLFREDGVPHAMASVRYEVFEEKLLREWRRHGRRAKLRRRYVLPRDPAPLFTVEVIDADRSLAAAGQQFDKILAGMDQARPGRTLAAAIVAIDLILRSQVAHLPMLRALILGDPGMRIMRFEGRDWLDWSFGERWGPGCPRFRVRASAIALAWLPPASRPGRRLRTMPPLPPPLQPLARAMGTEPASLDQLLRRLVTLRGQSNALHLPGVLAGYLAGARPSSALPESDVVRLLRGGALPAAPRDERSPSDMLEETPSRARPSVKDDDPAVDRCRRLFTAVRKVVASSRSRDEKEVEIRREIAKSGFGVGDVPQLLCLFTVQLLRRNKIGRRSSTRLDVSTILRYWDSLAGPMLDAAADSNLLELDCDEVTDLYADIVNIESPNAQSNKKPEEEEEEESGEGGNRSASDDSAEGASTDRLQASRRTALRLKEFHDFVSATYGADDPDWSELSIGAAILVGRPGIVLREEYLAALRLQLDGREVEDCGDETIARAFVLVVCARFGLRLKEAVGLYRRDVVDAATGLLAILVQSNPMRRLKTERSRRHVPQVEPFEEIERSVIDETLRRWEHRHGEDVDTPLLATTIGGFRSFLSAVNEDLRLVLKLVTRRSDATTHFLRHAYAMRVLSTLLGRRLGNEAGGDPDQTLHTRKLLLGAEAIDRRLLWAVSRLLGHAAPRVTLYSYVNCLALWLPDFEAARPAESGAAVNLDDVAIDRDYLSHATRPSVPPMPRESLLSRYLRFVRLVCIGQPDHVAERRSLLPTGAGTTLLAKLAQACEQLADDPPRQGVFKLLGGLHTRRLAGLASVLEAQMIAVGGTRDAALEKNWTDTIGRSRQIVLANEPALDVFARFLGDAGLTKEDVWLIRPRQVHASLLEHVETIGVTNFLHEATELGRTFQLDAARVTIGSRALTSPDRLVAVAAPGGKFKDSFELLLLWLIYLSAVGQASSPAAVT